MTSRFIDHMLSGVAASRPGAGTVPQGTLYFATDTLLISRSDGSSTWTTVFNAGAITEAMLSLSDVTTANVSTSAHGFAPKAPNDAAQVLLGTAAWGIPAVLAANAQTGTTYTLVLTDGGKIVTLSNASAITLTVPTNASVAFAAHSVVNLLQLGAGQVTVAGAGGVTVNSRGAALKLAGQYAMATLYRTATTDSWVLSGDIST